MIEVGAPADGAREVEVSGPRQLPDEIAVLPLRDTVAFPEMPVPLNIGQARSVELINDALRGDRSVVLLAGEPGVGKSTLLISAAARIAEGGARCLVVTGE